jgi:hypothetical protein
MMPHASSGLHSHQMKPLDLGLSASRTVRNKFLYRFPSLWNSVIATENRVRQVRRKMEEQKRGKRRKKEKRVMEEESEEEGTMKRMIKVLEK